jgi:anti-sigma-K factor RskA
MSMQSPHGCQHTLDAAAYVLGALEQSECERYREHLLSCAECRAEVAELQLVVDELPSMVPPASAPAELRERILTTVRAEAAVLQAAGHEADEAPRKAGRWRSPRFSFAAAGAVLTAAAVVIVALVLGGSSPHERVIEAQVTIPGARAALHQRSGHTELVVSKMPQPALGKIYEVWLSRGKGDAEPTSALFSVTNSGNGEIDVPSNLRGVKQVLVTAEPAGGSKHPTSTPVISASLPA